MALPATDSFNRVDSSDLGTNWNVLFGNGCQIASNTCQSNTSAGAGYDGAEIWNADTFSDDQYAEATISSAVGGAGATGLAVRGVETNNYYGLYCDNTNKYVFKVVSGSFTTFASSSNTYSVSNVIRLEAEGTTITPMLAGSEDTDLGAQTDSAISSGSAGVSGYGNIGALNTIDNWEGGDLGGGGGPATGFMTTNTGYWGT